MGHQVAQDPAGIIPVLAVPEETRLRILVPLSPGCRAKPQSPVQVVRTGFLVDTLEYYNLAVVASVGLGIRSVANFSPGRTKLAYARGRFRVANAWRVPILSDRLATWSDVEQLTFDRAYIEYVDVSSDGQTLFVSSDRGGNQDIWKLPANGGPMTQLTEEPTPDWNPRVSPDGEEIAFYSYRTGRREIWTMPSTGGRVRQVTKEGGRGPTWSPSGKEIAFASDRTGNFNVWIASADGADVRQITDRPGANWFP